MATSLVPAATALADIDFWRSRFPELTISEHLPVARFGADQNWLVARRDRHVERMAEDGYFQDSHEALAQHAPILASAAARCVDMGLPPVFLFLFDEAWQSFYAIAPALETFLGRGLATLPDFWIWYVDPAVGEAGWDMHVDKGARSLGPDGRPLSLTVWIPLSAATPLNSCIYLLPASRDPEYGLSPEQRRQGIDLAQVRALPTQPGDWLCWNQAVLHWGSASSRFAEGPRISMALEFQRGDIAPFNEPLIRDASKLDFSSRLWLVAKQILQYRHMYDYSTEAETLALSVIEG